MCLCLLLKVKVTGRQNRQENGPCVYHIINTACVNTARHFQVVQPMWTRYINVDGRTLLSSGDHFATRRRYVQCSLENDTVMNFIPIPIPTELKVEKVNIMLIKS